MTENLKHKDAVINLLSQGREVIAKYGWHQGDYGSIEDGFCSVGAVRYARRRASPGGLSLRAVSIYISARDILTQVALSKGSVDVIVHNDIALTNTDDALRFFDEAIAWARSL